MPMTATTTETNTLSPMNDPSPRFLADSLDATEMLIPSVLSFAERDAEFVNSESEGEEFFFISCLSPTPAADWNRICPGQSETDGHSFHLTT
jgi:hypothetical protein